MPSTRLDKGSLQRRVQSAFNGDASPAPLNPLLARGEERQPTFLETALLHHKAAASSDRLDTHVDSIDAERQVARWRAPKKGRADRMDAGVCGIDPGLGITGYAVLGDGDGLSVLDAGVCRFESRLPLAERLVAVESDITAILSEHKPRVVAVEQLYSHYNHPRTAILMGHARGVMLLAAAKLGIEVRSYSATQIKRYLPGNGRATKGQMQRAIQTTLGLAELPEPPDVADALAIALCCLSDINQASPVEVVR